ncbi:glycoside hydrolase family 2 TIM barrel-domain containing protein [Chitinophaga sp. Cy-1792]|uniref:glycoside hydrolase family 2 protein n=1 Tax=Chitinophaga sp. Cy-1792 TaxID=2608339 RepID=UPI001420A741|nr:glycoside hydrolase family 2 TIM barrel-domain containing protein [Chitinophaga sp. Cy-1792]NIG55343.1 glycoside hydrolase family 2 [Chitinophaga sp. Cy-1792]
MKTRWYIVIVLQLLLLPAMAQQTTKVYLSGTGPDHAVNWQFYCTAGMNAGKWTTIPVPSCWELQGFGKYNYGFAKDSVRGKESGLYKYTFDVPAQWKNKAVNLVFEGVMTDATVKINGRSAGAVHQGAFYAFRYDITALLKYGKQNILEVKVDKHSANESVNAAERRGDYWIFGGIFRPVWLEVLPAVHISNVSVNAGANGLFSASIAASQEADSLAAAIYDSKGQLFGSSAGTKGPAGFVVNARFASPVLWNPESPYLYKVIFSLYKNKQLQHTVSQTFGFRTVELRQRDGIYVNGVKVKMKGVNRHSFRPETGRTMSSNNSIEDVQLIKDMNMNAVRMSHYPPDEHFLEVCDSMGLFVLDELAGWHGHYDTPTGTKLLKEMMVHDRNHPSVVMWANGNEGGHNRDLDSLFYAWDMQQRPLVHPWELFNGIETQHYREYNYGIGNYNNGREIVMPTEFLHGQFDGGHGAGLEDYWEMMWHDPLSAGGFLWDFADQGVVRKDLHDSLDTDKFRGADGILGPHHEKEGSFFAIKEIWSPVHIARREIATGFDGSFTIENRYHYTNLKECHFSWKLQRLQAQEEVIGLAVAPDIAPSQQGTLQLHLPADWATYDVLQLKVSDSRGREIMTHTYPVHRPADMVTQLVHLSGDKKIITEKSDSLIKVSVGDISMVFNSKSGWLTKVENAKGLIPFANGPLLAEAVNNFQAITVIEENGQVIIESKFDRKTSYNTLRWTIYPSGWVRLDLHYFPGAYFTNYIGANFSFPEKDITSVTYMGDGPYRVWKNRQKGMQLGVWEKPYNNTETGEWPWIYPEFKGYYSNLYWAEFHMKENSFKVVNATEGVFLRLFTPAWKTDQWHNYEPLFPPGDISFLQGISSIGTKTQRNETTGPMGMKNIYYDYEKEPARALSMTLYFDFSGR